MGVIEDNWVGFVLRVNNCPKAMSPECENLIKSGSLEIQFKVG
jgi:hypothetical protein